MTVEELKAYRKMKPDARYMAMVLTAMGANLPDGWTNVSVTKLAAALHVHELTARKQINTVAASGLFEVRSVIRDNRQKVDVRPTFLGSLKAEDALTAV